MSNSLQGQLQILEQLKDKVNTLKQYTASFTVAYRDHLQQASSFDMMRETIDIIQRKGLPVYDASVKRSDDDLNTMLKIIEANQEQVKKLIQANIAAEARL
jgi:tryptophan 2,3-dioxygenase